MDETLEDIKRRYGKRTNPEVSETGDNLFGEINTPGSEEKQGSYLRIEQVENHTEEIHRLEKRRCG